MSGAAAPESGQWEGEDLSAFYSCHPEVLRFLETVDSAGIMYGFDWPAWQREAERCCGGATASSRVGRFECL